MHCEPLREITDRRFRSRISRDAREWPRSRHRGDVQDRAAALFGHYAPEYLTWRDSSCDVEIEDPLQRFGGKIEEFLLIVGSGLGVVAAGSVNQAVYASEAVFDPGCGRAVSFGIEHVAAEHFRLSTFIRDALAELFTDLEIPA